MPVLGQRGLQPGPGLTRTPPAWFGAQGRMQEAQNKMCLS